MVEGYVLSQEVHLNCEDDDVGWVYQKYHREDKDLPRGNLAHIDVFLEEVL